MKNKENILKALQYFTPTTLKNIIPIDFRVWVSRQLGSGVTFDGWDMRTYHDLPWNGGIGNEHFIQASQDIKKQFDFSGDGVSDTWLISRSNIDGLLWRHWNVSYCVRHAIEFAGNDLDMVECGVCDGATAFFALRELKGLNSHAKMHLYDAWMPVLKDSLMDSETDALGKYSNISLERTKKNLSEFDNIVFHPGYIPESLSIPPSAPEKISYLSIDLNSATPTIAVLEYFFPRLQRGGIVLFDDYGWAGYAPTRKAIDKFFADKPGIIMPLPTGQAIYYR